MRIALLADIHGNLPALEAVKKQLERLQPDLVVVDGDLINSTPFSAEVVDLVKQQGWTTLRGNHEFYLLDFNSERAPPAYANPKRWGLLHWLSKQITAQQSHFLGLLPDDLHLFLPGVQPICIAHGIPGNNRRGFRNEQPTEQIAAAIDPILERTLVSAHTHVQIDRWIPASAPISGDASNPSIPSTRGWHLINPGAVGLPMNGDPSAQCAIIDSVPEAEEAGGWKVSFQRIAYDRRPVLEAMQQRGMIEEGGVIALLFSWEVITARTEIIRFMRWASENGYSVEDTIEDSFRAYLAATGRDQYVRQQNPLFR